MTAVLDASAFLALVRGEPGSARVADWVGGSVLSSVNHAEVLTKLLDGGLPLEVAARIADRLQVEVVPFTEQHAVAAAGLRARTVGRGLSLGDRACLAVAAERDASAITVDRVWGELDIGVEIVVVR